MDNDEGVAVIPSSRSGTRKRHPIWEFFRFDITTNSSQCMVRNCGAVLKKSYTTNLKKHLQSHHNILLDQSTGSGFDAAQNPLSYSQGMEYLTKYPPENRRQLEFDKCLAVMVGSSSLPLSFVEREDFGHLIEIANPRLNVPGRTKTNRLINEKVTELISRISAEVKDAGHLALSMDLWTKKGLSSSYLGIVATFFSMAQQKKMTVTLAVQEIPTATHRKEDIMPVFHSVMSKYGIRPSQIIRILTDAGSNMIASFKGTEKLIEEADSFEEILDELEEERSDESFLEFTNHTHMKCFIHQLIRATKMGFENVSTVSPILRKVQELVKKINSSAVLTKLIIEKTGKHLIGYSNTRWNILYLVSKRLILLKNAVIEVLESNGKRKYILTEDEWTKLEEITEFLEPFYTFTISCSNDKNGISEGLPIFRQLTTHLEEYERSSSSFLRQCSSKIKEQINTRFGHFFHDMERTPFDGIFLLSTLLDIRYRRALSPEEVEKATGYLEQYVATFYRINEEHLPPSNNNDPVPPSKKRRFSFIQAKPIAVQSPFNQELCFYLNNPQFDTEDEDADPIWFWSQHKNMFPQLWLPACDILCIPISTANVEQVFSIATFNSWGRRGRLEGDHLGREVFLNKNKHFP